MPLYNNPLSASYPTAQGYNFRDQFERALEVDPNLIFVVGWNEWMAGRWHTVGSSYENTFGLFVDCFTPEFSRDIEPDKDSGLGDNYYMQLAGYIRKYKGASKPQPASLIKTITIDGSFTEWNDVRPDFRDDKKDTAVRNVKGVGNAGTYTNTTGRNDFKLMKVARDNNNIYFYAETLNDITSYSDANWMRLFIKTNRTDPNWKGFNYVINRSGIASTTTTLEKSTGGWNWSTVSSNIQYRVNGNKMEIAIPRTSLGLGSGTVDIDRKSTRLNSSH